MSDDTKKIIQEFKGLLTNAFGLKILHIVLFGSAATGKDMPTSDIDIAVVFSEEIDWRIKQKVYDIAFEAEGDSGKLLNITVFSKKEYEGRSIESLLLLENIRNRVLLL